MPDRPDKPAESYPLNPWPLAAVLGVLALGAVAAFFGHWRWASLLVAAALVGGAVLRLVLPRDTAGLLVIRRRWIDVTAMGALGVATAAIAVVVPPT